MLTCIHTITHRHLCMHVLTMPLIKKSVYERHEHCRAHSPHAAQTPARRPHSVARAGNNQELTFRQEREAGEGVIRRQGETPHGLGGRPGSNRISAAEGHSFSCESPEESALGLRTLRGAELQAGRHIGRPDPLSALLPQVPSESRAHPSSAAAAMSLRRSPSSSRTLMRAPLPHHPGRAQEHKTQTRTRTQTRHRL